MGYSARYHATSLIAIFLALAIGVVIGAALGGNTIDNTRKDLEQSLTGNLEDARNHAEELSVELGQANEFSDAVYPVLVRNDLRGKRIGVVAIGGLPGEISGAIDDALGPTGGRLVAVGVVREPVDCARSPATSRRPASPTSNRTPTPRPNSRPASAASWCSAATCSSGSAATSSRAPAATSAPSTA